MSYTLQSDLLTKAMTRSTRIMGVPFSFALSNIALFFMLMLIGYALTHSLLCMLAALGAMTLSHLSMMLLSLKEEKTLKMLISNTLYCPTTQGNPVNTYTPLNALPNAAKIKETSVAKHIPWSHLLNPHTVMTYKGELFQVLTLEGFCFQTEEDIDIDANKLLRNRLLYQMASPELAVYFYILKNPTAPYPEGEYTNPYAAGFNTRYREKLASQDWHQTSLYIVLMHKAPKFSGLKDKKRQKSAANDTSNAFYQQALLTLDTHVGRLTTLFADKQCRRLTTESKNHSSLLTFLSQLVNLQSRANGLPMQALNHALPYTTHRFAKKRGLLQITTPDGKHRYAAMLSLKEYPEETHACLLDAVLRMPYELILTQSFYFKHTQQTLELLERQQRKMVQTDDSMLLSDEITLAVEEVKAGRGAHGEHHISLCLIADTQEQLTQRIRDVESQLNQRAGLITVREEQGVELAFWAQLPGNHKYRIRQSLISSLNMAGFASLHREPEGCRFGNHWGEALTVLETLSHTPYYFNFHVGQVGNSLFLGPMGSGKTLLLSAFLALSNKYGGWRYVFDKDRGMEIIVRAMGGSYHVIEPGKPSGMAPLQLPDTHENRAFNILLLKRLLSTTESLSAREEKILEKAIHAAYTLPPELRIYRHIAPFFGVSRPGSLRERFDRWHSNGQHAWLFDNDVDAFNVSNRLSGQDIGTLLKPEFLELSTPLLMYVFHRLGACLDSSPTAVFIPEGWRAMSDPLFRSQLNDWSKTPRKNNMALIMDTQSPTDLASTDAGRSVVREAVTQVFFANPKAEWADYQAFNINEKEFSLIRNELPGLQDSHYFLLKQGKNSVVARMPLKGLENDITVLSASKASVLLLDKIRARTGDAPEAWLKPFTAMARVLKTDFDNDLTRFEPEFDRYFKELS